MSAAKRSIEPPMSDAQISQLKKSGSSDADIQQRKNQEQFFARLQMVGLFSEPVVREGDNVTDVRPPQGNNPGNITLQQPANGSNPAPAAEVEAAKTAVAQAEVRAQVI